VLTYDQGDLEIGTRAAQEAPLFVVDDVVVPRSLFQDDIEVFETSVLAGQDGIDQFTRQDEIVEFEGF
jgi:hypothetical protein